MIQTYSTVELLSSLPMVFSLESFWKIYADTDDGDDPHERELKFELLHNLVMFVCSFFRYMDQELGLGGELIGKVELFGHLDRFGSTLLYENDCLFVKSSLRRPNSSKLEYQLPKPLDVETIQTFIFEKGFPPQVPDQDKVKAKEQVHQLICLSINQ